MREQTSSTLNRGAAKRARGALCAPTRHALLVQAVAALLALPQMPLPETLKAHHALVRLVVKVAVFQHFGLDVRRRDRQLVHHLVAVHRTVPQNIQRDKAVDVVLWTNIDLVCVVSSRRDTQFAVRVLGQRRACRPDKITQFSTLLIVGIINLFAVHLHDLRLLSNAVEVENHARTLPFNRKRNKLCAHLNKREGSRITVGITAVGRTREGSRITVGITAGGRIREGSNSRITTAGRIRKGSNSRITTAGRIRKGSNSRILTVGRRPQNFIRDNLPLEVQDIRYMFPKKIWQVRLTFVMNEDQGVISMCSSMLHSLLHQS